MNIQKQLGKFAQEFKENPSKVLKDIATIGLAAVVGITPAQLDAKAIEYVNKTMDASYNNFKATHILVNEDGKTIDNDKIIPKKFQLKPFQGGLDFGPNSSDVPGEPFPGFTYGTFTRGQTYLNSKIGDKKLPTTASVYFLSADKTFMNKLNPLGKQQLSVTNMGHVDAIDLTGVQINDEREMKGRSAITKTLPSNPDIVTAIYVLDKKTANFLVTLPESKKQEMINQMVEVTEKGLYDIDDPIGAKPLLNLIQTSQKDTPGFRADLEKKKGAEKFKNFININDLYFNEEGVEVIAYYNIGKTTSTKIDAASTPAVIKDFIYYFGKESLGYEGFNGVINTITLDLTNETLVMNAINNMLKYAGKQATKAEQKTFIKDALTNIGLKDTRASVKVIDDSGTTRVTGLSNIVNNPFFPHVTVTEFGFRQSRAEASDMTVEANETTETENMKKAYQALIKIYKNNNTRGIHPDLLDTTVHIETGGSEYPYGMSELITNPIANNHFRSSFLESNIAVNTEVGGDDVTSIEITHTPGTTNKYIENQLGLSGSVATAPTFTLGQIAAHASNNKGNRNIPDITINGLKIRYPYNIHINGGIIATTSDAYGNIILSDYGPGYYNIKVQDMNTGVMSTTQGISITASAPTTFSYYATPIQPNASNPVGDIQLGGLTAGNQYHIYINGSTSPRGGRAFSARSSGTIHMNNVGSGTFNIRLQNATTSQPGQTTNVTINSYSPGGPTSPSIGGGTRGFDLQDSSNILSTSQETQIINAIANMCTQLNGINALPLFNEGTENREEQRIIDQTRNRILSIAPGIDIKRMTIELINESGGKTRFGRGIGGINKLAGHLNCDYCNDNIGILPGTQSEIIIHPGSRNSILRFKTTR